MNKLEKKFKPIVYPFIGSSFLTGDESEEVIKMNVKTCTEITTDVAINFLEFEKSLKKENRGGSIMYDLKGHYKYITEKELFDYFVNNVYGN